MKKFIMIAIACVCLLSLCILPAAAAGDLEIDFESLTADKSNIHVFSAALYTQTVIQFEGPAGTQNVGELDLSKYGSVTIEYGSDAGAVFVGDSAQGYLALTENGAVQDENGAALEDVKIIGRTDLEDQTNGGWANGNTAVTIPFHSDYNGIVYVSLFAVTKEGITPNGNFDGIAITKITFHEKTESDPPAGSTEKPADPTQTPGSGTKPSDTPKTGDVNVILAIAAAGIVLTVILQIKRIKI